MLDHLLPAIFLMVLNCWMEGPIPVSDPEPTPRVAITVPAGAIAQTPAPLPPETNRGTTDHASPLWPWILLGAAGGLGVGLGVYCLGRANATPTHRFYQDTHALPPSPSLSSHHPRTPSLHPSIPPSSHHPRTPSPHDPITPELSVTKINRMDALLEHLRSRDAQIRRQAIWELGQQGTSEAIQPLVNAMVDVDSQQRGLILAAIAEIGTRTLSPMNRALMISLQDANADVRKNAIRDLTRVYTLMAQMSHILTHAAMDNDEEVQATALWALEQFNHIGQTPSLMALESVVDRSPHLPSQENSVVDRS